MASMEKIYHKSLPERTADGISDFIYRENYGAGERCDHHKKCEGEALGLLPQNGVVGDAVLRLPGEPQLHGLVFPVVEAEAAGVEHVQKI